MNLTRNFFKLTFGALLLSTLCFVGCKKDNQTSRLMIRMTDDPADYLEVNVDVQSVQISYSDNGSGGWTTLTTNAGVYDLLDLQNDVSVVIADQAEIPVGRLNQLRLVLGQNNTLVTTHGTYPLLLSSQDKTGLKINMNLDMPVDKYIDILIDFDAGKSIVEEGNGQYRLKPVLRLEAVNFYELNDSIPLTTGGTTTTN
ncbi:MAG: DUF4382 domain-containing protein [Crocinitomicaceae bacterium]|nr:DUF4382 domain-containing protein [Crocinitomicaceae bacterium]